MRELAYLDKYHNFFKCTIGLGSTPGLVNSVEQKKKVIAYLALHSTSSSQQVREKINECQKIPGLSPLKKPSS